MEIKKNGVLRYTINNGSAVVDIFTDIKDPRKSALFITTPSFSLLSFSKHTTENIEKIPETSNNSNKTSDKPNPENLPFGWTSPTHVVSGNGS